MTSSTPKFEFSEFAPSVLKNDKNVFELPSELRGWFYLRRSGLSLKDQTQIILANKGSTCLGTLRVLLRETYPPSALSEYDKNAASRTNYAEDDSQWETDNYADEFENSYWGFAGNVTQDEEELEDESELDENDCWAELDDDGHDEAIYGYESRIDEIDDRNTTQDDEYNQALIAFREARDVIRNARVARGFFPVVVPAHMMATRKGKGKGKGKRNSGPGRGPKPVRFTSRKRKR